ncbi:PEGA domain-containing protein [bacterium]|nr:PEGA domain-containing protein [bacterium]
MKKIIVCGLISFMLFSITKLSAQEGFLRVTSVPEGVSVEVGGKSIGKTPLLTTVKPGKHTMKAILSGYESETETIEILQNEVTLVDLAMEKQKSKSVATSRKRTKTGNVSIITDWTDVDIYIDGYKTSEKPPVTIKDLSTGLHTIILVSGLYADTFKVLVMSGKTSVIKKTFEDEKKQKRTSLFKIEKPILSKTKLAQIEAKRQSLPANIVLALAKTTEKESNIILGEGESISVSFQIKKVGDKEWTPKEVQSKTKEEESFYIEKGTYDIMITYSLFKEPVGLINIFLGSKKEKIKEHKETYKKEFKPDTEYSYLISYDAVKGFSFNLEERALNTVIE